MFSVCTVPPDSRETKLGSKDHEVHSSADKKSRVVLMSCHAWKCVLTAISVGVVISEVSGWHLLRKTSSQ